MKRKRGQGEGTIRLRSDGRWEGRYSLGSKQKSIYGKSEEEVKDKLKKIIANITLGTYFEPSKIKVQEWLKYWLFEYKKKKLKPKTFESYNQIIECYINPVLGSLTIDKLNPILIQQEINNIKKSARTVKYTHTILKMSLKHAVSTELILKNPADNISLPSENKKEIKILDKTDLKKFMDHIRSHKLGPAFHLAITTGMRRGEILALRWKDIELESGLIKVRRNMDRVKVFNENENVYKLVEGTPKTKRSNRVLPILPDTKTLLKSHYTRQKIEKVRLGEKYIDDGYVFCNKNGTPLSPRNFAKHFYKVLKDADIPHTNFHSLRHTFASYGLENGMELKVISELLGHSSIAITADIYTHVSINKKKIELDKLNQILTSLG